MRQLVAYFVDGSDVDFAKMLSLGLIKNIGVGYYLTEYGKSFLD